MMRSAKDRDDIPLWACVQRVPGRSTRRSELGTARDASSSWGCFRLHRPRRGAPLLLRRRCRSQMAPVSMAVWATRTMTTRCPSTRRARCESRSACCHPLTYPTIPYRSPPSARARASASAARICRAHLPLDGMSVAARARRASALSCARRLAAPSLRERLARRREPRACRLNPGPCPRVRTIRVPAPPMSGSGHRLA